MPLRAQNDSSVRAWWTNLPESGLCEASTSSTLRLHPKVGPFAPDKTIKTTQHLAGVNESEIYVINNI